MFEKYTDRAREVLVLAQDEAQLLNHNYIGTEHLLLGLLREGEGIAAKALESVDVSLDLVRAQVREIIGQGAMTPPDRPAPFTPRGKGVLGLAERDRLEQGQDHIGTEHLLLALLREGSGVGTEILARLEADPDRIRGQVGRLLADRRRPPA